MDRDRTHRSDTADGAYGDGVDVGVDVWKWPELSVYVLHADTCQGRGRPGEHGRRIAEASVDKAREAADPVQ